MRSLPLGPGLFPVGRPPHPVVLGWVLFTVLVSAARFVLTRRYWQTSPSGQESSRWCAAFAVGTGMAGAAWGAAAIVLDPDAQLINQVFVVFVLGGMMLGGASLLAPRPEAFLAFLLPTGLLPAIRFLSQGDAVHLAMGLLVTIFTLATVTTTWRFYRTIESSINLRFENRALLDNLQIAKDETDALNQQLERRVEERTAVYRSTERLQDEITQRTDGTEPLRTQTESLGLLAYGIARLTFLTIIGISSWPRWSSRLTLQLEQRSSEPRALVSGRIPLISVIDLRQGATQSGAWFPYPLVVDAVHLARSRGGQHSPDIAADPGPPRSMPTRSASAPVLLQRQAGHGEGGIIEVRAENVVLSGDTKQQSGAHIRISIRDYGCGISDDILPLIFDPYFTTKPSATGLGLATTHSIVAKHCGRLSVESKDGVGTVFIVDLPASESDPAQESPVVARLQSGTGRLLVMDDEETLRTLMVAVLVRLGYEVVSASDGAEAIDLFEAAHANGRGFDVIVLDLTVPGGMGGVETARKLKELGSAATLIASSGYSDAPVMSSFQDYGFDDVLPKPWAVAQLSEVCRRAIVANAERKNS